MFSSFSRSPWWKSTALLLRCGSWAPATCVSWPETAWRWVDSPIRCYFTFTSRHTLPSRSVVRQVVSSYTRSSPPVSGEELLARPQLHQGGTGGQWHQAHQRSWHPRGVSLRDHVRGAESNHAGHPHRRAGDHRGGGDSVHGGRAGTEVKKKTAQDRQNRRYISCFPI